MVGNFKFWGLKEMGLGLKMREFMSRGMNSIMSGGNLITLGTTVQNGLDINALNSGKS